MENKPTITYSFSESGDENLFLTLSTHLRKILQNHPVQWQRFYGRVPHKLKLDVKFLPLTSALLKRNDLVTKPYFHVFWTDCIDIDFYRSSVKSEIASWLSELAGNDIFDWLIIVVTGEGSSRSAKPKLTLPRSSLADKIKADFCSKSLEKMHVLHDPMKESSKTNDSWSILATKLAALTITCLEESVTKYEDRVRAERERRNEKSWNFCSYFIMQEELAFMFEMLGLYEEALIQYNELDAMFTQYLLNAHAGVVAHWLSSFTSPITRWRSLSLWRRIDGDARQMLIEDNASLIDVRNYLFARHCHLLITLGRIEELTKLMHTFLHATIMELDILEVELPQGAKECWVFMSSMELAQIIERNRYQFQKTNSSVKGQTRPESPTVKMTDNLRLETANLWNLARRKLLRLGELCGLMPDVQTCSKDLQMVVDLISGIGEEEERDGLTKPPSLILHEALSSKENFRSQYLELSEMAMGTYKHTGRYRSARLIGNDLADFYIKSGEFLKAESFLVDAVRLYSSESWTCLCSNISEKLAQCYKLLCNVRRYIRFCCILMCDSNIDVKKRLYYCDEMHAHSTDLADSSLPILLAVFATVTAVKFIPACNSFRYNSHQLVQVNIHSKAPKAIKFHSAQLTLKYLDANASDITNKSSNDTMEEDGDFDAFSYATFSSDEESEVDSISLNQEKSTDIRVKKSANQKNHTRRRKRHRYLSSSSFDSVLAIHQKPKMDSSGLIQLVTMEDPCAQPSKCMANTMPSHISINIESEMKEEEVAWAGITCRTAHQLLQRQDSFQSLCSIHGGATNVVIEPTEDVLEVKNIWIKPGENVIEIKVDTAKSGDFTLKQLCLTQNRVHFVLPRILPIVSYTVTRIQPTLLISHKPRIYCGMKESFIVTLTCGDYELRDTSKSEEDNDLDCLLYFSFSKHFQIVSVSEIAVRSEDTSETLTSTSLKIIDSGKCSVLLPNFSKGSTVTMTMSCIYRLPDTIHKADWKYHRRTHSAPPSTVRQRQRPLTANNNNAEESRRQTNGIEVANSNSTPTHKPNSRGSDSPVKKFLSFVREVAERTDRSPKLPNPNSAMRDNLLEVTLEDPVSKESANSKISERILKRAGVEPRPRSSDISLLDGMNDWCEDSASCNMPSSFGSIGNSIITVKKSSSMSNKPSTKANKDLHRYGNVMPIPEETDGESDNIYMCNISVDLPWDDIPSTPISIPFIQPLYFSHRRHHYSDDEQILLVIIDNVSPYNFFLKNFCLHLTNSGHIKVSNLNNSRECILPSAESVTLAWKLCSASTASSSINTRFAVEIGRNKSDDESSDITATPAIYEFELENISTIYCVSTKLGDGNSKLTNGIMTTLEIKVKRLCNDPEHEHTQNGQQLLMFQVVDTRGRWAVCGKSTGIFSLPVLPPAIDNANDTPSKKYESTTTLEVMPLIDGWLHRPSVVLQRYLKRRSSEFDEELSSTDSPVLKPPLLMNFLPGEVLYLDQYKQVHITKSVNHQDESNIL